MEIPMPTIDELRKQLADAEREQRMLGQKEYDAVKKAASFDWRVKLTATSLRVECRYDTESRQRVMDWKARFAAHGTLNFRDPEKWHGMEYVLARTLDDQPFIMSIGGGAVVLNTATDWHKPHFLTEDQLATFLAGGVPVELQKPW